MSLEVASSSFREGEAIPKPYTGDGKNVSPPLRWESGPSATKSYAVICEDPDAPAGEAPSVFLQGLCTGHAARFVGGLDAGPGAQCHQRACAGRRTTHGRVR